MKLKRLAFIISAILLLASPCLAQEQLARMSLGVIGGGGTVAAPTCTLTTTNDGTHDYNPVANSASFGVTYGGQGDYNPPATKTICQLDFRVQGITGSAVTWTAEIYAMSGTALGSAPTGTCVSTPVSVTGAGWFQFPGLSCAVSNGTLYGLTITRPGHNGSASDYINVYESDTSTLPGTARSWWGDDKTQQNDWTPHEQAIKIYTME
jgi:hypothetical protein